MAALEVRAKQKTTTKMNIKSNHTVMKTRWRFPTPPYFSNIFLHRPSLFSHSYTGKLSCSCPRHTLFCRSFISINSVCNHQLLFRFCFCFYIEYFFKNDSGCVCGGEGSSVTYSVNAIAKGNAPIVFHPWGLPLRPCMGRSYSNLRMMVSFLRIRILRWW